MKKLVLLLAVVFSVYASLAVAALTPRANAADSVVVREVAVEEVAVVDSVAADRRKLLPAELSTCCW